MSKSLKTLKNNNWLHDESLQQILSLLEQDGHQARVIGGAIRNAILNVPIDDIDIATTRLPEDVISHLNHHTIKTIPTGLDHGTITAILNGKSFEVTTLRADIDHDGRHAKVQFSRDWAEDAKRRDFTINAISVDRHGQLYDPENGLEDIKEWRIRFIGDPDQRILEDHLRILRFFRIYAHYGEGQPDRDGLKACARAHEQINQLSSERIWSETKKIFLAKDVTKVLNWMRVSQVLTTIIPESEKWGIAAIPPLMQLEKAQDWPIDPFLRLMAIIPPRLERVNTLIERMKLSKKEAERLFAWVNVQDLALELDKNKLAKTLYYNNQQAILDRYRLEGVRQINAGQTLDETLIACIEFIENWQSPQFPISGNDLMALGYASGQELGKHLKMLETHWVEQQFQPTKQQLLTHLKAQAI